MNATEKQILELLKDKSKSQNEIARIVGVPRSMVQKVSDTELGVSPESLKSISVDQISFIQGDFAAGRSKAELASKYSVSSKTISRALLVRISNHDNGVTVISPNSSITDTGEFDTSYDIAPGGFATLNYVVGSGSGNHQEGTVVYVGAYLNDHDKYLVFAKDAVMGTYQPLLVPHSNLTALEDKNVHSFNEDLTDLSEITEALVNTGKPEGEHFRVWVNVSDDNEKVSYAIQGKINAKGQIRYKETVTNMTVRVNVKNISVYAVELPKKKAVVSGESTKSKLQGAALSEFLGKHQILLLPDQVVITKDGVPRTITTDHKFYSAIVDAILLGKIDDAFELMDPRKIIDRFTQGRLLLSKGKVTWDGYDVTGMGISSRILAMAQRGDMEKLDRLTKFMDKVYQNPSSALVQSNRIYDFMAYSDIEIDEDGDILVYKSVRANYMDKHSNTISNAPGTIVRMARSFVNDNNTSLCSYGLHVCSLTYLRKCFGSNGSRVVRCKLNPKDIVSITDDYGNSKIRCCEYLVLDDYTTQYNRQFKSIDMEGVYRD